VNLVQTKRRAPVSQVLNDGRGIRSVLERTAFYGWMAAAHRVLNCYKIDMDAFLREVTSNSSTLHSRTTLPCYPARGSQTLPCAAFDAFPRLYGVPFAPRNVRHLNPQASSNAADLEVSSEERTLQAFLLRTVGTPTRGAAAAAAPSPPPSPSRLLQWCRAAGGWSPFQNEGGGDSDREPSTRAGRAFPGFSRPSRPRPPRAPLGEGPALPWPAGVITPGPLDISAKPETPPLVMGSA
jgi:hypothetical protein